MIEPMKQKSTFLAGSAVLLLAMGMAGCSSPAGGGGGSPWNTTSSSGAGTGGGNTGATGSGSGGVTSGSGGVSAGSSSGQSISPGGGGSGSSSSGSGPTSSSGASGSSGGSGSGGSGDGATDLAAPASSAGIQIATPDYNANDPNAKNLIVMPSQEIFLCYYVTLPSTQIEVGGFQSWMSSGSSHHFIVYQSTGQFAGAAQPSGTISACGGGAGQWVYATSTPGTVVSMNMPQGVGYPFPASTQIVLNMHFINPGSTPLYPKVKLNILFASNVQYQAASMVSFNIKINVPAATSTGPGTQTVSGTCTAPAGSKFFIMSTHTHKHATAAVVNYVHGGQTTEIVHTGTAPTYPVDQMAGTGTDWEHPGVGQWTAPNFLTVSSGDTFTYSCSYSNTASTPVTVGETAASNEMCMAVGYYFPAGSASCN
jgi:hypothetical protein